MVTGGAGFIGANLIRALTEDRDDVTVIDDFSSGLAENLNGVRCDLMKARINDSGLEALFRGHDAVVHLAARTSVVESMKDPWPTFEVNAAGTLRVLEASRKAQVPVFVFASSNAALGNYEPPLDESKLPKPISPYGASKLAGEAYCHSYGVASGMRIGVLRFSNAYGPYMLNKDSVIPRFIRAAQSGQDLVIYGDGSQTRDFIYAGDIVSAIQKSIREPAADGIFQIATGVETSISDLAQVIIKACNSASTVNYMEARAGEIQRNRSDISKARRVLHFDPAMTLGRGIERTVQWFKAQSQSSADSSPVLNESSTIGE